MRILLLDPQKAYMERLQDLSCALGDVTILTPEKVRDPLTDSSKVDIIIGGGDLSDGSRLTDLLLTWRTPPIHTWFPVGS